MEAGFSSKNQDAGVLKQRLTDDLKRALRGEDKLRRSVIRLVMAAIKNAEIARQATCIERKGDETRALELLNVAVCALSPFLILLYFMKLTS